MVVGNSCNNEISSIPFNIVFPADSIQLPRPVYVPWVQAEATGINHFVILEPDPVKNSIYSHHQRIVKNLNAIDQRLQLIKDSKWSISLVASVLFLDSRISKYPSIGYQELDTKSKNQRIGYTGSTGPYTAGLRLPWRGRRSNASFWWYLSFLGCLKLSFFTPFSRLKLSFFTPARLLDSSQWN